VESELRAKQIAETIALHLDPRAETEAVCAGAATASWPIGERFTIRRRGGCAACDPGACTVCGYLFTGTVIEITHCSRGRRTLSDRAVHYLAHGMAHYPTAYVVRNAVVDVTLDLEELAGFLDL